jgi:hypothetical protein
VKIASFQPSGNYDRHSYMNNSFGIGDNDLIKFTACMKINLNYLRGKESFFFTYANPVFDDALTGALYHDDENLLRVGICLETEYKKICLYTTPEEFFYQEWHHLCFTMAQGKFSNYQILAKLYYDGSLKAQG